MIRYRKFCSLSIVEPQALSLYVTILIILYSIINVFANEGYVVLKALYPISFLWLEGTIHDERVVIKDGGINEGNHERGLILGGGRVRLVGKVSLLMLNSTISGLAHVTSSRICPFPRKGGSHSIFFCVKSLNNLKNTPHWAILTILRMMCDRYWSLDSQRHHCWAASHCISNHQEYSSSFAWDCVRHGHRKSPTEIVVVLG